MNQVRYVLLMITLVALVGVSALALDVPNTFVSGDVISAAEMNANFTAVEAAVTALEAAQPRVAHEKVDGQVDVDSATMVDVAVVSIDAPAAGVVLVQFTAQAGFGGTPNTNGMALQIDTTAGGGRINTEYYYVAQTPANTSPYWLPVATQRAFEVGAGTHEFRAEAQAHGTLDGTRWMYNPSITATWYPADSVALSSAISTSSTGGDNLR